MPYTQSDALMDRSGPTRIVALGALLIPPIVLGFWTPPTPPGLELVWWVGLVPVAISARNDGWRGTAVATFGVLLAALLVHAALAAVGRPVPPMLAPTLLTFSAAAATIGWVVREVREDRGDVEDLALIDPLTGLPNRRHARVFLETMFGGAERGRPVSVVLFDIDDLTKINEEHGPERGNRVLLEFSELLLSNTRRMNLSSRFGGEEFLAVLSGGDEDGARAFAERIREAFRASASGQMKWSISAGVACYHPSMRSPEELVAAADLALSRSKSEGGDRVRVFGRDVGDRDVAEARRADSSAPRSPSAYLDEAHAMGRQPPPAEFIPQPSAPFGSDRALLLVEHEEEQREILSGYLEREGFAVESVTEPPDAIQALRQEFDVVLVNLQLPGLSSSELVRAVKSRWPATQVLVITGDRDARVAAEALNAGADLYLYRPLDMPDLQSSLVDALARRDRLRAEVTRRHATSRATADTGDDARALIVDGLTALAEATELRDEYSRGHARRMSRYALAILEALDPAPEGIDAERLSLACRIHNVGMLSIPDEILNKTGPLTPEEFDRVRRHPEVSRRILEPSLGDEIVMQVAGWHHERWDGSGYPDGLAGEAIPLAARIAAIADALDAMTSPRSYRQALAWEDAVRQVRDRAGTHFDPGLVPAFKKALPELRALFSARDSESEPNPQETSEASGPANEVEA